MRRRTALVCLVAASLGSILLAHDASHTDFLHAMHESMKEMNTEMDAAPMTGNPDHDFASMMLPHHQGAIDMAKLELRFGKDPMMRRLAQEILADQQSEIELMQLWLRKNAAAHAHEEK